MPICEPSNISNVLVKQQQELAAKQYIKTLKNKLNKFSADMVFPSIHQVGKKVPYVYSLWYQKNEAVAVADVDFTTYALPLNNMIINSDFYLCGYNVCIVLGKLEASPPVGQQLYNEQDKSIQAIETVNFSLDLFDKLSGKSLTDGYVRDIYFAGGNLNKSIKPVKINKNSQIEARLLYEYIAAANRFWWVNISLTGYKVL